MAPEFLDQLLSRLGPTNDPDGRVLSGFSGHEDATVIRMPQGKALVQTVDFLAPIGNDPFVFGQIAAANALSDVYAMGGEPWCAMNIACFPSSGLCSAHTQNTPPAETLSADVLSEILRGGLDKIHEAGAVLAGGHTVEDEELKYGLAVTGIIDPDCIATNTGLQVGDQLLLTKPIGTGVLATVVKARWAGFEQAEKEFSRWATRLNKNAGWLISELRLKAATDITGFGLGGHALEMAEASRLCISLNADDIPLMDRVLDYAADGLVPAGSHANRSHCAHKVAVAAAVDPLRTALIFDAQTSGGLLLAVPDLLFDRAVKLLQEKNEACWHIGQVLPARKDGIVLSLQ